MAVYAKLVPSSSKETEWRSFANMLERSLPSRKPASQELLELHRIFSNGARMHLFDEQKEELIRLMHFIDKPDLDREGYENLIEKAGKNRFNILSLPMEDFDRQLGKLDVLFDPAIRGQLRSYGKRRNGTGDWKTVYASHTFAPEIINLSNDPVYVPPVYFGLSPNLSLVYEALCWKYDSVFDKAQTLDEKLLAESFLHLVGTHLLHPFWDGNGRTFTAHIALMLAREGIGVKEYEHIRQITIALINTDGKFLERVLHTVGISLIRPDQHGPMLFDIDFRKKYMSRLRAAIADAIDNCVNQNGPYFGDYTDAKNIMREWLAHVCPNA